MSMEATFDIDFDQWIVVMKSAVSLAPRETKKVVGKGCNNIKKEWRARWTGYAHIPHLPWSITYDVDEKATVFISGVVGPQRGAGARGVGNQWELGSIIEFGVVGQNSPIPGGWPSLDAEEPRFVDAMADLGIGLLSTLGGRDFTS